MGADFIGPLAVLGPPRDKGYHVGMRYSYGSCFGLKKGGRVLTGESPFTVKEVSGQQVSRGEFPGSGVGV